MKAMILAAGRGERMRPLTDSTPKPLLKVKGIPLIEHQLLALMAAGVEEFVINTAVMGEQIQQYLGKGEKLGIKIQYSDEGDDPLETAGGIINALPLLGNEAFIVANADIYTDFNYGNLPKDIVTDVHLVLVNNPDHHPDGDFALIDGMVSAGGGPRYTYSGIGLFHPKLFTGIRAEHRALAPILFAAAEKGRVSGQLHRGIWSDIGTPQRLEEANNKKL